MADKVFYECDALTGGTANALDAISYVAGIVDESIAITNVASTRNCWIHRYDASSSDAESSPFVVKPDDAGANNGRWILHGYGYQLDTDADSYAGFTADDTYKVNIAGTDRLEVGTSGPTSNSHGLIQGGATAPLFERVILLQISDGTNAETIKCITTSKYEGDAIGSTDNIAVGATTGDFSLDGWGSVLTIEKTGLSGNCKAVVGCWLAKNTTSTNFVVGASAVNNDIQLEFEEIDTGTDTALHELADDGIIQLYIAYRTDA